MADTVGVLRSKVETGAVWVVVLDYNTGPVLRDCVGSFREVDYENLEIVVVDNGSTDGIAGDIGRRYPDVHVVRSSVNLGYTGGNNVGIEYALDHGAEYVLIVNPDTAVVDPSFVAHLVAFMERTPDAGIAGPIVYFRSRDTIQNTLCSVPSFSRKALGRLIDRPANVEERRSEVVQAEVLNGVCILLRRACLEEVGLYDPRVFMYGDDWDFTLRAERRGWRSYQIPVDGIVHLQKESGYDYVSMVNFLLKRNAAYVLRKNGRPLGAALIAAGALSLTLGRALLASFRGNEKQSRYWKFSWHLAKAYIAVFRGKDEASEFGPPAVEYSEFSKRIK